MEKATLLIASLSACSGEGPGGPGGNADMSGGTTSSGGSVATGGTLGGSGGVSSVPSGGNSSTGGTVVSGGGSGSGGEVDHSTGGAATGSGGAKAGGGAAAGGDPGTEQSGGAVGAGGASNGCEARGFHVEGSKLLDVNCNEFRMRGANVPHAWYADRTQQAFVDLASVGGNAVRVVLATGAQWTRTSGTVLSDIITWAKENQLVAVLEVHDSTGFGDSAGAVHPDDAVAYWTSSDILPVIEGQEAYVLINIANEPFGNSQNKAEDASTWQEFHVGAVQDLRDAGLEHTLVVDAPNWGQDWQNIMRDGSEAQAIFDADPLGNVVFSVHMYDVYSSPSVVTSYFDSFFSKGLPLIVGEFAADHGEGTNVDEVTIMTEAESRGFGYLGWSWSGNGEGLGSLDMTNTFDVSSLTPWGSTIINGAHGLSQTGQICTCFD